jgi:hypothetical protein
MFHATCLVLQALEPLRPLLPPTPMASQAPAPTTHLRQATLLLLLTEHLHPGTQPMHLHPPLLPTLQQLPQQVRANPDHIYLVPGSHKPCPLKSGSSLPPVSMVAVNKTTKTGPSPSMRFSNPMFCSRPHRRCALRSSSRWPVPTSPGLCPRPAAASQWLPTHWCPTCIRECWWSIATSCRSARPAAATSQGQCSST